jgi:hypothetical protein
MDTARLPGERDSEYAMRLAAAGESPHHITLVMDDDDTIYHEITVGMDHTGTAYPVPSTLTVSYVPGDTVATLSVDNGQHGHAARSITVVMHDNAMRDLMVACGHILATMP